jgi:hypothetical protein
MPLDTAHVRQYLKDFNFKALFIEELGWDHYPSVLEAFVDGQTYALTSIAQKRGMVAYIHAPKGDGVSPDYPTRRKIERQVSKSVHEHLIIYTDKDKKFQTWQWVKREAGKPTQCREHTYYSNQPGDALIQKLNTIAFSLAEEEGLTIVDVASRVRAGFDVDRVTKRFYDRFKSEHGAFLKFLEGIPDEEMQRWYASVMLNRLMFIYFIQKKGFLDNNINYLRDKLIETKKRGKDRFYKDFLCPLFFEGFAKKEHERKPAINQLLGRVPFLNGGIFQPHQLEELYGKSIHIVDAAFEKLFSFFDQYQWHLDERPLRADNEINPDVLGYIFEKYVNQKQMGAYYTKEDITEYISKNTIIPYLFDEARTKCKIAFVGANSGSPDSTIWCFLQADPDRYIYDAVKKGVDLPLPAKIGVGLNDVSKRTEWNKPAPEEYALPTEIWREVVARRQRYEEVRNKLINGGIQDINDLITYNLNIRQFAQDVIENCESTELLRAFWHAIEEVTILDPTCGSGAFLFAALNILEPLYEACLDRMEVFLDELDRSGEKHRPEKFGDFRKVLDQIKKHPNRRYFIFKSIIVNNLYGVDIMEEAIEICKLRLFLKLVAQIEIVEDIEPLPDIDFNIRAGNTLVGYATYDEVKKAVLGDAQGKFDLGKDMQRIDEKAQDVDRLFALFRQQQTELDGEVTAADKQELRKRLKALEDELNHYLAGEYKIDPNKKTDYEKWLSSHKPFHWFIDFYGIVKAGGFDVIIGNPPYVEYGKVKHDYTVRGYQTESCSNLYAFMMESSIGLLQANGRFGMIVPISFACSDRMAPARKEMQCFNIWISNFAIRPQPLFADIMQRNAIVIAHPIKEKHRKLFSTNYLRWTSVEREYLFRRLWFAEVSGLLSNDGIIPKISTNPEIHILKTMMEKPASRIGQLRNMKCETLYFHDSGESYWTKTLWKKPAAYRNGVRVEPSQWFPLEVNVEDSPFIYILLNSNILYWLWTTYTDCRHMTKGFIEFLPLPSNRSVNYELVEKLREAFTENTTLFEKRPGYKSPEIKVQNFKHLIDKLDGVLAEHYGFEDEELDFLINYDIKYRMGLGGKETEDGDNDKRGKSE